MNATPLIAAVQAPRALVAARPFATALGAIGAGVSASLVLGSSWLAFVALAPVLALATRARVGAAAASGAAAGVVAVLCALRFVPQAAHAYAPVATPSALPLYVVGAALLGAPWGLATGLGGMAERRCGRGPLVAALALTAWELTVPNPLPLALGAQVVTTPLAPLAAVSGQSGLTLLVTLSAAAAAELALARVSSRPRRADRLTVVLALGAVLAAGLYGVWRRAALDRAMIAAPQLELAVAGWALAPGRERSPMELEASLGEGRRGHVDLQLLPESSLSATLPDEDLERVVGALLPDAGSASGPTAILGVTSRDSTGALRNVALALGPRGITRAHEKARLLPFAEAPVPLPILGAVGAPGARYVAGRPEGALVLATPRDGREGAGDLDGATRAHVEVLVCYEDLFGGDLRRRVGNGPRELVAVLTNDAWLRASGADDLHALAAALRAVELGRSVAVSNRGGRARVVDPAGRELAGLSPDEAGWLYVTTPLLSEATPFARWGAGPLWLVVAALALAASTRGPLSPCRPS